MVARARIRATAAGKHRGMAASYYAAAVASQKADRAVVGRAGEKPLRCNAWLLFLWTLRLCEHTFDVIGNEDDGHAGERK